MLQPTGAANPDKLKADSDCANIIRMQDRRFKILLSCQI